MKKDGEEDFQNMFMVQNQNDQKLFQNYFQMVIHLFKKLWMMSLQILAKD